MNLKEVKDLIELVSEKGIAEFELERQGFRIRICRARTNEAAVQYAQPVPVIAQLSAPVHQEPAETLASAAAQAAPVEAGEIIKSPIVGTFYRFPSPGAEPFVEVGSRVKKGQVVCII